MRQPKWTVLHLLLVWTIGTVVIGAQEPAPEGAFKTVHLVTLAPADASALMAALADVNTALDTAGHTDIRYRLFKVTGKQAGSYNYLWEASWPSAAVYEAVHKHPAFEAATKKHPEIDHLRSKEIYNRYVEVRPAKR
jgi:hypothetical protein